MRLKRKAETGEQWAEICALEGARIAAVTAEHIAACPKGRAFADTSVVS
jgi:hypothetical protein